MCIGGKVFGIRRRSAVRSERTCSNNGSVRFSYLFACPWLAGAPCDFLLDSCEGACVNDGRVVILDIVFVPFAVVCLDPLADAVGHINVIYTVHMESGKNCWVMTEKLLISQKQSPRKKLRHSGFYARCAVIVMFP